MKDVYVKILNSASTFINCYKLEDCVLDKKFFWLWEYYIWLVVLNEQESSILESNQLPVQLENKFLNSPLYKAHQQGSETQRYH